MTRLVGESGAEYRLDEPPAALGGEAVVYRAIAKEDGAVVAVRVELVPGALRSQTERQERLAADPVCGPSMLGIWDRGTWEGRHFQVLDWVPHPVGEVVPRAALSVRRAAVGALVEALGRLHARGEAHGDVKPGNILLRDGDPRAPLLADPRPDDGRGHTPGFAAPEQVRDGTATLAADRYALACTAWALLAGEPPTVGSRGVAAVDRERFDRVVGDPALREVLGAMLDPRAERRPPLEDLERALRGERPPGRRRAGRPLVAAASIAALAFWAWKGAEPPCPAGFRAGDRHTCVHPDGRAVAWVEAGSFTMGRVSTDDPERLPDADPHEVVISHPFWLGTTEVTQAQWRDAGGGDPVTERQQRLDGGVVAPCDTWHGHSLVGDRRPVVCVSFVDVIRWLNGLSARDGLAPAYRIAPSPDGPVITWDVESPGWRLPTEAEWEWAAQVGGEPDEVCARANLRDQSAPQHWGNESPCDDRDPVLAPVGERPPNHLGLYDLEGNALEWVWDRYGTYPEARVVDPVGPASGPARVARGASWNHVPRGVRARYATDPELHGYSTGFRLARNAPR